MAVDSTHKDYNHAFQDWRLIDMLVRGERAVKEAGGLLLPRLRGQTDSEYEAMKNRGEFFNAIGKTVEALVGMVFRKSGITNIEGFDGMREFFNDVTLSGEPVEQILDRIVPYQLLYGRCGVLCDFITGRENAYAALYDPFSIINWNVDMVNGVEKLTMVVLKETMNDRSKDAFEPVVYDRLRVLRLNDDGQLEIEVYQKTSDDKEFFKVGETVFPKIRNKAFDFIPFYFIGSENMSATPNKPPLLDLGYINAAHWRKSVDLAHGLHWAALPTPWAAGFSVKSDLYMGSSKAWVSEDPNAKCGFLEFSGTGLAAIEKSLDRNENQMAVLGSRIISKPRDGIETAETARIHKSGETSSLMRVVNTASDGVTKVMRTLVKMSFMNFEEDVYYKLNTDFVDSMIDSRYIESLLKALQSNSISLDTFLHNMQKGEVLPEGRSVDDEKIMIDTEFNPSFSDDKNGR